MPAKPSRRHNPPDPELFLCQEMHVWTYSPRMKCVARDSGFACACGLDGSVKRICLNFIFPWIFCSITWMWLLIQGLSILLSQVSFTCRHTTLQEDTCGCRENNLLPFSVGLDAAQIIKLDVKQRGWQSDLRVAKTPISEFIFHGVNESWKYYITLHRSAGCKLTVIKETYIKMCTAAQLIGREMH